MGHFKAINKLKSHFENRGNLTHSNHFYFAHFARICTNFSLLLNFKLFSEKVTRFWASELVEKIVWRKKPMQTTTNSTKRALNLCWKMMPMFDDLLSPKLFGKNWENAKEFPIKNERANEIWFFRFIHSLTGVFGRRVQRAAQRRLTLSAKQLALDSLPLSSRRIF